MLHRASPAPRGPRNATPPSRSGGARGGIQKRKTGAVRVDRDGDLVMDPTLAGDKRRSGRGQVNVHTSSRGGAGRGKPGPARGGNVGTSRTQQAILRGLGAKQSQANILASRITTAGTTLCVKGLGSSKAATNPDGGVDALLGFLERKASALDPKSNRVVKIKKSSKVGDSVFITASQMDIAEIQKLDKFTFASAVLSIQPSEPHSAKADKPGEQNKDDVSTSAQETKELLKAILASRYDNNLKLLNLSALAQDVGLQQMGVFDGSTTTSKIFPALMVVCDGLFKSRQEKREAIVSVTLTDNDLVDVSDVAALAHTFPDLKNLDLSRNRIAQLSALDAWGNKLKYLSTLVLNDNPIVELLPTMQDTVLKKYPYLEILNQTRVRTSDEVEAAVEAAKSPIPIVAPDFRDVGQVAENFIPQFILMYDVDRHALLNNFYDAESVVSISINMNAPRNPKNSKPIPPWVPYIKHSRNLVKINNLPTQMTRLYRGPQEILSLWTSIPATRHPDLHQQAESYLIECNSLPGLVDPSGQSPRGVDGLIVTMHGEYIEDNDKPEDALRSFSRTFVLGPGPPGGIPIRVVSDMMTLRAWGPLAIPRKGANPVATDLVDPEKQAHVLQEAMVFQLAQRSGMTADFAIMCLQENNWELEKAFNAFVANKSSIPKEAFVNQLGRG